MTPPADRDLRALYEEKLAVLTELRKVLDAVRKADKYSKVVAESILANLERIEREQAELTQRGTRER